MSSFVNTLKAFCDELTLTFPELETHIARARTVTSAQFWKSWVNSLDILEKSNADALFSDRKGFIIAAVRLTRELWAELSAATQAAIWKYLCTLTLESAMEVDTGSLDMAVMQKLMAIMMAGREGGSGDINPLMEKIKSLLGGSGEGFVMPEIPERLRNGRISKLAEEMAKQFNPEEFGIDPAMLKGDNIEEILKRLADLYQRDPTLLIGGAKRVAERIKTQILGGSLNREELVAEAQEFIAIFKEHPMFKEIMDKATGFMGAGGLAEMFGSAGSGSEGAPSERRRAVQERLRKKMAERSKK